MTKYNHPFQSAMLSSCDYDSETKELTVTFNGGKSYTYVGVLYNTYEDLINARSAGQYFNSIKKDLNQK